MTQELERKRISNRLTMDVLMLVMSLAIMGTGIAIGIFP
jgi:hypothetical protein